MEIKSVCLSPKYIGNKLTETYKKTTTKLKEKKLYKLDKKKIIIAASVLMVGAAVYLNYIFFLDDQINLSASSPDAEGQKIVDVSGEVVSSGEENVEAGIFAETALERQKARENALEVLRLVVDSKDALQESKDIALSQMNKIAEEIQTESNIESLMVMKGFENCVAVISDGKCNVVVKCDELMPNQISQIKEIVYEQASITPLNTKIIQMSK